MCRIGYSRVERMLQRSVLLSMTAVLALAGAAACGNDGPVSDEDFAEEASSICDRFADEQEAALAQPGLERSFDLDGPYRTAAEAMRAIEFTDESAPNGAELVRSYDAAAQAWDELDVAFRAELEALRAESEEDVGGYVVNEAGEVFFFYRDMFDLVGTDIDPALWLTVKEEEAAAGEAAEALGLSACVPRER